MNWKRMLAYVTGSVAQELLVRNQYLVTENRILRQQIKGRVILSDPERLSLARISKQLSRKALAEVAQIVRPETPCSQKTQTDPNCRVMRGKYLGVVTCYPTDPRAQDSSIVLKANP